MFVLLSRLHWINYKDKILKVIKNNSKHQQQTEKRQGAIFLNDSKTHISSHTTITTTTATPKTNKHTKKLYEQSQSS